MGVVFAGEPGAFVGVGFLCVASSAKGLVVVVVPEMGIGLAVFYGVDVVHEASKGGAPN